MKRKVLVICFSVLLLMIIAESAIKSSANDAEFVNLNTTVQDAITEDVDNNLLYQINIKTAGRLNVVFEHDNLLDTKTYWIVYVYAEDLSTILQTFRSTGTDEKLIGDSLGLSSGTYYIKVVSDDSCSDKLTYSEATYSLTPKFKATNNWEIEYNSKSKRTNDEQNGASNAFVNKTTYGSIGSDDDVDFYKVTIPGNGYITLNFKHKNALTSDICWYASLVNAKTDGICNVASKGTRKSITTPAIGVTAGTYYIKITSGDDYYNTMAYNFTVKYTPSNSWEKEYNFKSGKFNDKIANANTIKYKKTITGTISEKYDVDYYKIKLKSKKSVKVVFSHKYMPKKQSYWKIYVYDSRLHRIASFRSKGVDDTTYRVLRLKKGTYFIKVTGNDDNYKTTKYNLTVK